MKAALLPDRGVVKVAGDDARKFLNGLITSDIAKMTPARAGFAALLTPQGKMIVDFLLAEAPPADRGGFFLDCPRVETTSPGDGILVSAKNITWVTGAMYANAMATGGIRDARAIVTAPTPVSGTAALTGIFKAFSYLTGHSLSPAAEEGAAEELVRTGELGQSIGPDRAASFVERTKEEVVRTRATTYAEIRSVTERVAREQSLTLSEDQLRKVTDVMIRLSKLNLNLSSLRVQLKNFTEQAAQPATGISGFIAQIIAFFQSLFKQLAGFVGRLFR